MQYVVVFQRISVAYAAASKITRREYELLFYSIDKSPETCKFFVSIT